MSTQEPFLADGLTVVLGPVVGSGFVAALQAVEGVGEVAAPGVEGVPAALQEAEVLVTFRWSDDWIVPGLRWIQSVTAGTDQFPIEALSEAGVVLTSAVGIHDVQVSEHAFGLLLGMTRGIAASARNQVERVWEWPPVVDLSGMTLGVLGLGVIGEAVARRAKAFEMQVLGTKRFPRGVLGSGRRGLRTRWHPGGLPTGRRRHRHAPRRRADRRVGGRGRARRTGRGIPGQRGAWNRHRRGGSRRRHEPRGPARSRARRVPR